MKLKDIENPKVMDLITLNNLFLKWFPNGFTKEEACVLYHIFVNKYFLHLPSNKIIDAGGTSFGTLLSQWGKDGGHWLWFHGNCEQKILNPKREIIEKIHKRIHPEIKLIDDKKIIKKIENYKWEIYRNSFIPGEAEWIEEKARRIQVRECFKKCLGI